MPLSNVVYTAELVKEVPEKNQARFYRLARSTFDLFAIVKRIVDADLLHWR